MKIFYPLSIVMSLAIAGGFYLAYHYTPPLVQDGPAAIGNSPAPTATATARPIAYPSLPVPSSNQPTSAPTLAPTSSSTLIPATSIPTPLLTPVSTPVPTPTSTPVPAKGCGSGGPCTAADIAPHNSRTDCWMYLSPINKAYDITSYVSDPKQHPGGDVIVPLCGTNMYDFFIGNAGGHAHSNSAVTMLQAYYIGPFQ